MLSVPAPASAVWPLAASADPADDTRIGERAAALLSRAIAIPTVSPGDGESDLAALYVDALTAAGVDARLVDAEPPVATETAPDAAVAWGRVPGRGSARPVVLLSHLDVVPAGDVAWDVPPFEGRVTETHVHGRGALDAKGVSVIHLLTLVELARRGETLDRDVVFLATPGEEIGGAQGAGLVATTRPELLGDAEYLLTEGGAVRVQQRSPPIWGVTVTEKSPCWVELTARGTPGHAAVPMPDAAVPRLVAALDRVRRIEPALRVLPEVDAMFRAMAPVAAEEDAAGYRDLADALAHDASFRRRFLSDPSRSALVSDTISITVVEGSGATNSLPQVARARIDARLLRGHRCEDFIQQLESIVRDDDVEIEQLLSFEAGRSSAETALFTAIERVAARLDPGAIVVPRIIPGFTDAHYFRALGITAYGFTPRWLTAEDTRGIHGPNERISIENLERGVETLVAILVELDEIDRGAAGAGAPDASAEDEPDR